MFLPEDLITHELAGYFSLVDIANLMRTAKLNWNFFIHFLVVEQGRWYVLSRFVDSRMIPRPAAIDVVRAGVVQELWDCFTTVTLYHLLELDAQNAYCNYDPITGDYMGGSEIPLGIPEVFHVVVKRIIKSESLRLGRHPPNPSKPAFLSLTRQRACKDIRKLLKEVMSDKGRQYYEETMLSGTP